MRYRHFGKTGWRVSEIGFGGARIGGLLADDGGRAGSLRTLEAACDAGINFYDTANMYSQGESEVLIGKAFRGKRDKVLIATKGGYRLSAHKRLVQLIKPIAKPIVRAVGLRRRRAAASATGSNTIPQDFSAQHLKAAVDKSLRRLQSDYIDLYQLHSPSTDTIRSNQLEDALGLLSRLKNDGKIREFGIALDTVEDATQCLALAGIASLQIPFGLMDSDALNGFLDEAFQLQHGIIARGCFGGGALKQSIGEAELRTTEAKWKNILEIRKLAVQMNRSPLEVALQFSLSVERVSVTILGMRNSQHLEANIRYLNAGSLSPHQLRELMALSRPGDAL